jgi:para-aminobenzoate synthetase component I
MFEIQLSGDELVRSLLKTSEREPVCILDSCGVSNLDSYLLIAAIRPIESLVLKYENSNQSLDIFDEHISKQNLAYVFTLAYDFGLKLENISQRPKKFDNFPEPDISLSAFDCLIAHNYKTGKTFITGNHDRFQEFSKILSDEVPLECSSIQKSTVSSNFTRQEYKNAVEEIKESIRQGDTYQANLTQQFRAKLSKQLTPQCIFLTLRKSHPAAFSAFLTRKSDVVVSISPERLIHLNYETREINASPIKGTRERGATKSADQQLKLELLKSEKDRAENIMIVDLLRNDLGRICEFGSVKVDKLCELEVHPTLFHLVSSIKGKVRKSIKHSDIIKAVFPCGSITGAPKIRTMRIIDELETANRGLSMGAIGYHIPKTGFDLSGGFDMNVAIRTMVVRNQEAIFNVGGGIVIDSDAESEYQESILKAQAIFNAINADFGKEELIQITGV